jgi:hypothetical protein
LLTPEVLIALIGIVGTVAGTLLSAEFSNRSAKKREDEQWQRQLMELRRQERLNVCEDFATQALLVVDNSASHADLVRLLNRLRLRLRTSDETVEAASALYEACSTAQQHFKTASSEVAEHQDERLVEVRQRLEAFLKVAGLDTPE